MEIVYKDCDIAVCIKPPGILSVSGRSGEISVMSLLSETLAAAHEPSDVFPIHRLDREVSGLMVFARNPKAAAVLSAQTADHERFCKEYLAVVRGCPQTDHGFFEDLLFKDSAKNKSYVVQRPRKGVKPAKLEYQTVKKDADRSLVRIRLYTGRTHQIRVQFASRKMPLFGDRKYGGPPGGGGIALYSCRMAFLHPASGQPMTFESLPEGEIFRTV